MSIKSIFPVALCLALVAHGAFAAPPKLDKETCEQLQVEQAKFAQTGIMSDIQKGAEWGKSNLSPERLREVEHFIMLDEQLKFACRVVTLTEDAKKAEEAAKRLELNPNADPTVPPEPKAKPAPKPAAEGAAPKAEDGKASAKKSTKPSSATGTGGQSNAAPAKNSSGTPAPPAVKVRPAAETAPVAPKTQRSDAYKPPRSPAFKPPAFVE